MHSRLLGALPTLKSMWAPAEPALQIPGKPELTHRKSQAQHSEMSVRLGQPPNPKLHPPTHTQSRPRGDGQDGGAGDPEHGPPGLSRMTIVTGLARKGPPQLRREKRPPQDGRRGGPSVAERLTTEVASGQRGAEGRPSWGPVPGRASPQNAGLRGQWGSLGESPRAVGSRDSAPAGTHRASHTAQPRAEAGTSKEPDRTHRLTRVSLRGRP